MSIKRKALGLAALVGGAYLLRDWVYRQRAIGLQGRVVAITGGSRGLGFALARQFAREGARLCLCARDQEELDRAQRALELQGAEVLTVRCDVTKQREVEQFINTATERFGRVDILVNNAGIIQTGPLRTMKRQDYEDSMNVMFWGVLNPTLAVLPQMLERRGGRIVNITSIGGKVAVPHLAPYGAGKYAAVGLSEAMGVELAREGIKVVTIVPGLMRTGSFLNAYVKGKQEIEFTLFSLLANLPPFSISAEEAARRIVQAAKRGEPEVILSLPAKIWVRLHGLMPGTMLDVMGLVNRLLPNAGEDESQLARGMEVHERVQTPLLNALMSLGLSSAEKFNQYPGPHEAVAHNGHAHNGHAEPGT